MQFIFITIHGPTVFFGTIYEFYCTISANFYFYLPYFQQKISSFSKVSKFQIDPSYIVKGILLLAQPIKSFCNSAYTKKLLVSWHNYKEK